MKITILGCGSSGGVPLINGDWGRCNPHNPKNRRRRASLLIQDNGHTILIDAGPDLRLQLLEAQISRLDAILFTHAHADHIGGIPELRILSQRQGEIIPLYGDRETLQEIERSFSYAIQPRDDLYQPFVSLHEVEGEVNLSGETYSFLPQKHGNQVSYSIRWQNYAYSTDFNELPDKTLDSLQGLNWWIADCLQFEPHLSHSWFERTLMYRDQIRPKQTILTHMNHNFDYEEGMRCTPQGVILAYDGMTIEI